ncbi:uncharacterized protein C2orf92 homolog isoform X2 [Erinaceus europaeus]|uniref:Uncharacterized protein C2orf92 homolog isoform X2 n=1 Tax=Erinaceus europaeus TaxID=9365 RepID=A0ABM3X3U9_ERIEU|nr:uncharacterized protein C2orf92 homolog isoform X2 [Erinaceus europaeus]
MAMKGGAEIFFVLLLNCWQGREIHLAQSIKDDPRQKNLSHIEFSLNSDKQEKHLARLFDDILEQVIYKIPYGKPFDESRRTAGKSIRKKDIQKITSVARNSSKLEFSSDSMNRTSNNSHISEETEDKEPSVLDRSTNKQLISFDKKTLQGATKSDIRNRDIPCAQFLQFLEKNIIIAALTVAGILVVTMLLLFVLTIPTRKKRPLYPPANVTYNIFVLNGKTWWQKCQKTAKRYAENQKQLESSS